MIFPGSGSTTDASAGLPLCILCLFCPAAPSQRRRAGNLSQNACKGCRFIVATRGSKGALVYDGHDFYKPASSFGGGNRHTGSGRLLCHGLSAFFDSKQKGIPERMDSDKLYRQQLKRSDGKRSFFCSGHVSGTGSIWTWQSFFKLRTN